MIQMCENTGNEVRVLMNEMHQWGVIDQNGVVIVPFGKYSWIDNFDQGLARVNTRIPQGGSRYATVKKWGIINEKGEEVLPLEVHFITSNLALSASIETNRPLYVLA